LNHLKEQKIELAQNKKEKKTEKKKKTFDLI